MRQLQIGTVRDAGRLHLATLTEDGRGFSKCGRRMREVWPVGEREVSVDAPWCGSCLNQEMRDAVRWAELDYSRAQRGEGLFRVWAHDRSPAGNDGVSPGMIRSAAQARVVVCSLALAVDALREIADLDDVAAASVAFHAAEQIKVELDSLGGDA